MMVTRFQRWHLTHVQDVALEPCAWLQDPAVLRDLERAGNCWTVVADGLPVACGGTLTLWPGRSVAWAIIGATARAHIVGVTKIARDVLRRAPGRVECTVRADFEAGQRWACALGFRVETPCLAHYGPQGEDHVGYVMVN